MGWDGLLCEQGGFSLRALQPCGCQLFGMLPLPIHLPCHPLQEVALIGMTAYMSYLLGDVLGLSGILALFVCAVAISHYALHNISGALGCGLQGVAGQGAWLPPGR